ncbi:MAG TPA: hypothetical protein VIY86_00070, partial [Pirellulaceae bacterium]
TIVDAYIDFHSTIPAFGDDFGYVEVDQGDHQADFWLEFRELQPNVLEEDSTSTGWTTGNFADVYLNAEVDITFETQFSKNRPLSYYETLGENFGIAFHNVWAPSGDFDHDGDRDCDDVQLLSGRIHVGSTNLNFDLNFDQQIDQADLVEWLALAGGANLPSGNAFRFGDANLDGVVDGTDYNIWNQYKFSNSHAWCKGNFNADGVVDGSDFGLWNTNKFLASDGSTVPEPCPIVFVLLGGIAGTARGRLTRHGCGRCRFSVTALANR